MKDLKITIDGEKYSINQHEEIPGLFYVRHYSGVHKLARRDDGEWKFIEHTVLTHPISLERVSEEIEKLLK